MSIHALFNFGNFKWRLPSRCCVCHTWPSQALCPDCLTQFSHTAPRCPRCALLLERPITPEMFQPDGRGLPSSALETPPLANKPQIPNSTNPCLLPTDHPQSHLPSLCNECTITPPPLDACYVAVDYVYPWTLLVSRFKFQAHTGLAAVLGQLLLKQSTVQNCLAQADYLVPMPLSTARLQSRGFNQSLLLAQQLVKYAAKFKKSSRPLSFKSKGLPKILEKVLVRTQDKIAQHHLGRVARQQNIKNSFQLNLSVDSAWTQTHLTGKRIVLIDDVMTTGSSLFEAARALRHVHPAKVEAIVFARTPLEELYTQ